jgi:hypothetical protein
MYVVKKGNKYYSIKETTKLISYGWTQDIADATVFPTEKEIPVYLKKGGVLPGSVQIEEIKFEE